MVGDNDSLGSRLAIQVRTTRNDYGKFTAPAVGRFAYLPDARRNDGLVRGGGVVEGGLKYYF